MKLENLNQRLALALVMGMWPAAVFAQGQCMDNNGVVIPCPEDRQHSSINPMPTVTPSQHTGHTDGGSVTLLDDSGHNFSGASDPSYLDSGSLTIPGQSEEVGDIPPDVNDPTPNMQHLWPQKKGTSTQEEGHDPHDPTCVTDQTKGTGTPSQSNEVAVCNY